MPVQIDYDVVNGVTVKYNGNTIFTNVAVPGFTLQSGDRFGVGARTGGSVEKATVDNLQLTPR